MITLEEKKELDLLDDLLKDPFGEKEDKPASPLAVSEEEQPKNLSTCSHRSIKQRLHSWQLKLITKTGIRSSNLGLPLSKSYPVFPTKCWTMFKKGYRAYRRYFKRADEQTRTSKPGRIKTGKTKLLLSSFQENI